ncbi:hypothetical protein N7532_006028 [Penicillium argentinense]|uniref:Uncharacterized protein n=1 Tax=Penicillium argentinense TaxID=1131581 RepID=A0A9W9FF43_9EURO|nr:uncharacterized protein N7532_006028 [Penicillium argentinense]KAJ5099027.1 hypothetical protein N7532_006028 [Penicillium argentinense]
MRANHDATKRAFSTPSPKTAQLSRVEEPPHCCRWAIPTTVWTANRLSPDSNFPAPAPTQKQQEYPRGGPKWRFSGGQASARWPCQAAKDAQCMAETRELDAGSRLWHGPNEEAAGVSLPHKRTAI